MTLRLSVVSDAWRAHISSTAQTLGPLLPVVKGNGYGFSRPELMRHAAQLSTDVAVGSVHELGDVPPGLRPFVLTPVGAGVTSAAAIRSDAVLAVGSVRDLDVLARLGASNSVVIKVASSMQRYGAPASEASALRVRAEAAGHHVVAWSVHLPLNGNDDQRAREAIALAGALPADLPLHLSHVGAAAPAVRSAVKHRVVVRAGTPLWIGDKSMLALHADVITVRDASLPTAGYRAAPVAVGSRLVMVGCGTAQGVTALDDGRSPFHFARQRLDMLEAPHMHTTMLVVTDGPHPNEGEWVDVQQPLTRVLPDVIVWN
jgi:alanine racemase